VSGCCLMGSEWLLFNGEWVSGCCLMPTQQFFSYVSVPKTWNSICICCCYFYLQWFEVRSRCWRSLEDSMAIYRCQTASQVSLFIGFLISWISLPTKTTKIGTPQIKVISQLELFDFDCMRKNDRNVYIWKYFNNLRLWKSNLLPVTRF
jgi:hypothetical protein